VILGLSSAVFLAIGNPLKGVVSLLLGLLVASAGLDNPGGLSTFHFGNAELAGGLTLIPIMIGMFAVSEIIRNVANMDQPWEMAQTKIGNVFHRHVGPDEEVSAADPARLDARHRDRRAARRRRRHRRVDVVRDVEEISRKSGKNSAPGTSRASSRRAPPTTLRSPVPGFPALVFGIPGRFDHRDRDRGALYQGPESRPDHFHEKAPEMYAIFLVFILANLLMVPLGLAAIRARASCCARRARC
jgi:TctA family transporter